PRRARPRAPACGAPRDRGRARAAPTAGSRLPPRAARGRGGSDAGSAGSPRPARTGAGSRTRSPPRAGRGRARGAPGSGGRRGSRPWWARSGSTAPRRASAPPWRAPPPAPRRGASPARSRRSIGLLIALETVRLDVGAEALEGVARGVRERGVAAHELGGAAQVEPQQVVAHQHLPIAGRARADPDR